MQELVEGVTPFVTQSETHISKDMPVFYNPVMKLNRDLSLLMICALDWRVPGTLRIGLPMEASGVRAARILNEVVVPGHVQLAQLALNDISPLAMELAQKNIAPYATACPIVCTTLEANNFMRASGGFDYLDIDPFGSPNPFLDAAVQRISRDGVLAVTATDTAALSGTYPAASAKKYWAVPSRTWVMHEVGLRILIRKVQLIGAQYERTLTPILSLSLDHYYRVFFRCEKSQRALPGVLKQHEMLKVDTTNVTCTVVASQPDVAGPLWTGALHDPLIVEKLLAACERLGKEHFERAHAILTLVKDECRVPTIGFVDLHLLAQRTGIAPPKRDMLLEKLGDRGARTHLSPHGIKTTLSLTELAKLA